MSDNVSCLPEYPAIHTGMIVLLTTLFSAADTGIIILSLFCL